MDPDVREWQEPSLLYTCERSTLRRPAAMDPGASPQMDPPHGRRRGDPPDEQPGWVCSTSATPAIRGPRRCASSRASPTADGRASSADRGTRPNGRERHRSAPGAELEPDDRAISAQALSLVHAAMRTKGSSGWPRTGRRSMVEPTDRLGGRPRGGDGFARLRRAAWDRAPRYYLQFHLRARAASARRPRPGERRDVYRLAGCLLVATPEGAYGLAPGTAVTPLYDLDLGAPDPEVLAEQVGEAWRRTYPNGPWR